MFESEISLSSQALSTGRVGDVIDEEEQEIEGCDNDERGYGTDDTEENPIEKRVEEGEQEKDIAKYEIWDFGDDGNEMKTERSEVVRDNREIDEDENGM